MPNHPGAEAARHARLVSALFRPAAYPHPVDAVELIDTAISSVLLAGDFAYKLKKPVHFDWIDFSTLAKRRLYCDEEIRLNRRTAPALYLGVVAITGRIDRPVVGGTGPILDYAVRMHRFGANQLMNQLLSAPDFDTAIVDRLADCIAQFHHGLAAAVDAVNAGTAAEIWRWAHQNFIELRRHARFAGERGRLDSLADWTRREFESCEVAFVTRRLQGQVRECHGDLHLRNVVVFDGQPVPFDCIDFNPALSWIDVISEIAFPFMDFFDHGQPRLAWRFLNRYLEASGDYPGVMVLRFYAVYRAVVRAKVACLRMDAADCDSAQRAAAAESFSGYIGLAQALSAVPRRLLVLMHGLSGSGKSIVAQCLLEELGAVRIRSDVERRRIFGVAASAPPGSSQSAPPVPEVRSAPPAHPVPPVHPVSAVHSAHPVNPAPPATALHGADATRRTYDRLALLAADVIDSGYPAIIDASFLDRTERARMRELARHRNAAFAIVDCTAPVDVLRRRVVARARAGNDPSDATAAVVEQQICTAEPLTDTERAACWTIDTNTEPGALSKRCEQLASDLARLGIA